MDYTPDDPQMPAHLMRGGTRASKSPFPTGLKTPAVRIKKPSVTRSHSKTDHTAEAAHVAADVVRGAPSPLPPSGLPGRAAFGGV